MEIYFQANDYTCFFFFYSNIFSLIIFSCTIIVLHWKYIMISDNIDNIHAVVTSPPCSRLYTGHLFDSESNWNDVPWLTRLWLLNNQYMYIYIRDMHEPSRKLLWIRRSSDVDQLEAVTIILIHIPRVRTLHSGSFRCSTLTLERAFVGNSLWEKTKYFQKIKKCIRVWSRMWLSRLWARSTDDLGDVEVYSFSNFIYLCHVCSLCLIAYKQITAHKRK